MTLFGLLQWVMFYTVVGAFFYLPIYSVILTDTDWGWDHKFLAAVVSYLLPAAAVFGVVGIGFGMAQFFEWSKTVTLW